MLKLTHLGPANTAACNKASLEGKLKDVANDKFEVFINGDPWEDAEMRRRLQSVIKAEIRLRIDRLDKHLAELGIDVNR